MANSVNRYDHVLWMDDGRVTRRALRSEVDG